MADRDPIINPASSSRGSPTDTSRDRVKSVKGGGANFTPDRDLKSGAPAPNNPYSSKR